MRCKVVQSVRCLFCPRGDYHPWFCLPAAAGLLAACVSILSVRELHVYSSFYFNLACVWYLLRTRTVLKLTVGIAK